ncbi:receptor-type adenylate cyclase b [Leishmania donovani]|uniref:Receptor-type adenylate cyclase b n=1 Tax=Leishmania donovani TaxID=5661 RepID=E9BD39_LEIDO|nr:receptor-type adenylate cyclase b [Leishmania donovani]CBZ33165.1 receptor-type adenylate cyclase b [Leishmania donovani]
MNRLAIRIATVSQARCPVGNNGAAVDLDVQHAGTAEVMNPLLGEGSCISDGARARHSGLTAVPPSAEPPAMRMRRVGRKVPERPTVCNVRGAH